MKVTKHTEENQQLDHGTQIPRHRTECMTMGKTTTKKHYKEKIQPKKRTMGAERS